MKSNLFLNFPTQMDTQNAPCLIITLITLRFLIYKLKVLPQKQGAAWLPVCAGQSKSRFDFTWGRIVRFKNKFSKIKF